MDEQQAQPDEQAQPEKPPVFKMEQYVDASGRTLMLRTAVGDGTVTYIGQVTGKIPINPQQVASVPHNFEIEAATIQEAFERFDEVAAATWPLHKDAAIAKMRARAEQQRQPKIVTPGVQVPLHMGRLDQQEGPH